VPLSLPPGAASSFSASRAHPTSASSSY
jgi:hypothetical protein